MKKLALPFVVTAALSSSAAVAQPKPSVNPPPQPTTVVAQPQPTANPPPPKPKVAVDPQPQPTANPPPPKTKVAVDPQPTANPPAPKVHRNPPRPVHKPTDTAPVAPDKRPVPPPTT